MQDKNTLFGESHSSKMQLYKPIQVLGNGSFGSVWLCDWRGMPPNAPLSPMQRGDNGRPKWLGKHLVAVKRIEKKWEGGKDEWLKLTELEVRLCGFYFLDIFFTIVFTVVAQDTNPQKYHSFVWRVSSTRYETTLFCFWIHGRKSTPVHQISQGTQPRRRSYFFDLSPNRVGARSHSQKWLFS